MATEYFTITQGGRWRGEGGIDIESGTGKIDLHGQKYHFTTYLRERPGCYSEGMHESLPTLPGPGCNQPNVAESDDGELPF